MIQTLGKNQSLPPMKEFV
uniref:Uncharacterized protein n=1 Tax=Anguilla anguilla TaxID=7936 RepID=A0A0E9W0G0_ANGAN